MSYTDAWESIIMYCLGLFVVVVYSKHRHKDGPIGGEVSLIVHPHIRRVDHAEFTSMWENGFTLI